MIRCQACGSDNLDSSQYCDECGTKLKTGENSSPYQTSVIDASLIAANATSVGVPEFEELTAVAARQSPTANDAGEKSAHSILTIERGATAGTEFPLTTEVAILGRWDADNGVFPDVDLDQHDREAKVSRKHARILRKNGEFLIEDLGSTNGTYINRGRRLLPGSPHPLRDNDEIIVGKTFLRFKINE